MPGIEQNLVAVLQEAAGDAVGGLTITEIRRCYRQKIGNAPSDHIIARFLGNADRFRRMVGDRYCLIEQAEALTLSAPTATTSSSEPTLFQLPQLLAGEWAIVDTETTGVDPTQDRVFQVSAVRFQGLRPVAVFNRYLSPAPAVLSDSLKRRLGIAGDAVLEQLVAEALSPEVVLSDVRQFLDGIPWVAHNARFDRDFLATLGLSTPFILDTLELAGLVLPTAPSLAEEEIANALGLALADIPTDSSLQPLLANIDGPAIYGRYHNALTDVLQLSRVFAELYRRLPQWVLTVLERQSQPGEDPLLTEDERDVALAGAGMVTGAGRPVPTGGVVPDPLTALRTYLRDTGRGARPAQETMLDHVTNAWHAEEACACEAPTGTGKTLAYLFPALCTALTSGKQAIVSTATKNLQDQLADELTRLSDWAQGTGHFPAFTWAVRKGAGNYLCLHRLRRRVSETATLASSLRRPEDVYALLFWLSFADASTEGLLEEVPNALLRRFPAVGAWREELRAASDCRLGEDDGPHALCFQASHRTRYAGVNLLVMNHALWLTLRESQPAIVENVSVVAVDEAHELEDVATAYAEQGCESTALEQVLRRLYDPETESGLLTLARSRRAGTEPTPGIGRAIGSVRQILRVELPEMGNKLREFWRGQRLSEDPRYGGRLAVPPFPVRTLGYRWRHVVRAWDDLTTRGIVPLCQALETEFGEDAGDGTDGAMLAIGGAVARLTELARIGEATLNPRDRRKVCVLNLGPTRSVEETASEGSVALPPPSWSLTVTPVDVSPVLAEAYSGLPVLFASATLDTGEGGGMRHSLDRIGLGFVPAQRRHVLPPVLPYATQAAFGIARSMVYAPLQHTSRSFTAEFADASARLVTLAGGRTLLLFTARNRMEAMTETLREHLTAVPWEESDTLRNSTTVGPVLVQGDDLPHRLVERFRDEPHTILAGVRRFWQGVDVPGNSLSLVFLEKLPFPSFHDPLVTARSAHVERHGGNSFNDYLLPAMLIAFKQGFGRLIRSGDDWGAVLLFDRRVATKTYLSRLQGCLPGFVARDPKAETTWDGLVGHLESALPGLFPGLGSRDADSIARLLPGRLDAPATACPSLSLPLPEVGDTDEPALEIQSALAAFGHKGFRTREQRRVTTAQLEHRDVLGLIPTGGGKSLTFQLPALVAAEGMTLVISPLIALMRDQVEGLNARGFENVAALYSGQGAEERGDILNRAQLGRLKLLYVAPERLRDPVLLETLRRTTVRALVVDEAHCLYSWGPHFRPEFLALPELFQHIGRVPVAALTATAPPARRREILMTLGLDPDTTEQVIASFARPELRFVVYGPNSLHNRISGPQSKLRTLLKVLTAARRDGDSAVVYVNTTSGAEDLASQLQLAGFGARAYHGRMETAARHDVQDLFMDDHIQIVVCTKAFGMGVDKQGIRYVIHYDVPGDLVDYTQEAGRGGRSLEPEQSAWCVLLYHPKDAWIHDWFAEARLPVEDFLVSVLNDVRENAVRDGDNLLYDIPAATQRLGESFPDTEETAVNVALYRLGNLRFLRRGTDAVIRGLLFRSPGAGAVEPLMGEEAEVTETVRRLLAQSPEGRQADASPTEILDFARKHNCSPVALSEALARRAVAGQILFAPIARAAVFTPLEAFAAGAHPVITAEDRDRLRREAAAGWSSMEGYAEQSDGCRTVTILRHLGEPMEPVPCGHCDLCAPSQPRPWADIADDDIPRPSEFVEAPGLLLEAILWNEQRERAGDGRSLGEATLWAILGGEEFYLKKYNRFTLARRCPFYGILRSLSGGRSGIKRLFERLVEHGYCERQRATLHGESEDSMTDAETSEAETLPTPTFNIPRLTGRGRECLRTGEYIDLTGAGAAHTEQTTNQINNQKMEDTHHA